MRSQNVYMTPVARAVPYDNSISGLTSTNVQSAIDELNFTGGVSASPGFTWGGTGTQTAGSYLSNDSVPSNSAGRIVPIGSGNIKEVFVAVEVSGTYSFDVRKNTGGGSFTTLGSVTLAAARTGTFQVSWAVARGDELAVRISPTSADNPRNVVVGVIIKGQL